jgi:NlpC/P60 family putative phage cell wall peptidase
MAALEDEALNETLGAQVVELAKTWLGTPYRHQGTMRAVGCDCLGLIRGIWREIYGEEPEQPAPYAPDWAERGKSDPLVEAALRHFGAPVPTKNMRGGDVLLFRWREGYRAKHLGIYCGEAGFIHAYEQHGVVLSPLVPQWRSKIACIFRFPNRTD